MIQLSHKIVYMHIFLTLILKLLPLYAIMAAGFVLGRKHSELGHATAIIQINFIAPVVIATSMATLELQSRYLILPAVVLIVCCTVGLTVFAIGRRLWLDNTPNLMAYSAGSGNTGYFGIPVALILFPENMIGLLMLAALGVQLYDNTLGYYLIARGHYSIRDSIKRLVRLPLLHASLLGLIFSALHVKLPLLITATAHDFRGAYIVLGALMIGFGLSKIKEFKPDKLFLSIMLGARFVVWPLLIFGFIAFDRVMLHLFSADVYPILFLIAIVPLPANAVAFALLLNVQPQKAAIAVVASTIIALFYIPAILIILGFIT